MLNLKIPIILSIAFYSFSLKAQTLTDNSFEISDTTKTGSKNWQTFNQGYSISTDTAISHHGKRSIKIIKTGDAFYDGFFQVIPYVPKYAQKLVLTGFIKTDRPNNNSAGLFIRVQNKNNAILILKINDSNIKDSPVVNGWTKHSIEIYVPENTVKIICGGSLSAEGTAWYDDLDLHAVEIKNKGQSKTAGLYLNEAYSIIKENALRKDSVNLPALLSEANKIAGNAQVPEDCYDAITFMLDGLGDKHSSFWTPAEARNFEKNENRAAPNIKWPSAVLINDSIGYIVLPYLQSGNKIITRLYADTLQVQIRKIDSQSNIIGWIVDLRKNLGGTWINMIAAIGPVLGNGISGYLTDVNGKKMSWGYRDHCAFLHDSCSRIVNNYYDLKKPNPKVAIITGQSTTSAGEVIAIAFRQRPSSKSFGQPTYGVPTLKYIFPMSDSAYITLTVARFSDRTGIYYGKVLPDVVVESDPANKNDLALLQAEDWVIQK